ncbi:hypothetical protein PENSPDRAFT_632492 [Peniophora sp. CONT]|nr:hypothetical protein PENSPDRAFT_632492 [Peniophora sp. CONT]
MNFDGLPVELVVSVLEELDLTSLVIMSDLSRRLREIISDPFLNPWRQPIARILANGSCADEPLLRHIAERSTVPRQNAVDILSLAPTAFILFDFTIPNLKQADWETIFRRRFLPGWVKWKRDLSWREVYKRVLMRVWHRSQTSCTADEAWTKFVVLNKNGTANELDVSSRNINPANIFHDMKVNSNLAHLETRIRLVVELADVRILAFGVLNRPRGRFTINDNARVFLHPPGIEREGLFTASDEVAGELVYGSPMSNFSTASSDVFPPDSSTRRPPHGFTYERMMQPLPTPAFAEYPFYTSESHDKRWLGSGSFEENGRYWVGPMMLVAQIIGPQTHVHNGPSQLNYQDTDLINGPGRSQYASFTFADFDALAPWMKEDYVRQRVFGQGLGH